MTLVYRLTPNTNSRLLVCTVGSSSRLLLFTVGSNTNSKLRVRIVGPSNRLLLFTVLVRIVAPSNRLLLFTVGPSKDRVRTQIQKTFALPGFDPGTFGL